MSEATSSHKDDLVGYLVSAREALLWKTEGLSEYDLRRPLTPTSTNLLGLVKHVVSMGVTYFGTCLDRPFEVPMPWLDDDAEPNADLWVPAGQTRAEILDLWHRGWAHCDATIATLPLDATGTVPWWPPAGRHPTLHRLLAHVNAEVTRHAGHADILRELIDGRAGLRNGMTNLPSQDEFDWDAHHVRVQEAADRFNDSR